MDAALIDTAAETSPFALFAVDDIVYGISSNYVLSIEILGKPTPIVDSPDYSLGIVGFRGDMIPLIGLRKLFGIGQRGMGLRGLMADRRADHERWIATLEDMVRNGGEATLQYDPHKCKFGLWLDSFTTNNNSLNAHINKMRGPHSMVHRTGHDIAELAKTNKEEALIQLRHLKETHVKETLELIDACVGVYLEGIREMLIVLSVDGVTKGIVVDDIVSVEYINKFLDMPTNDSKSKYVRSLAKRDKDNSTVLLMDEELLTAL